MAMLAEPRKKTKYGIQPYGGFSKINKRCDGDTSSAAFKIMASMGWMPGKGLGPNESGGVDPIRIRLKSDDSGLGYKVSEDDALAKQSEFHALLLQLNAGSNDGEIESDEPKKESKKPQIKSLEKQSERSTKRVHYKKFTRGKDLSRASEKDLNSILGVTCKKPKVKEPEPVLEKSKPVKDTTLGLSSTLYLTAGSSVDYFKKRFQEKKDGRKNGTVKDEATLANCVEENKDNCNKDKRKSVTWGDADVSYVDKYIKDMVDTSGSLDGSLNDSEDLPEPPAKKKKKSEHAPVEISEDLSIEPLQQNKEKKKKKNEPTSVDNSENLSMGPLQPNIEKKRKKNKLTPIEISEDLSEEPLQQDTKKKKKKKDQHTPIEISEDLPEEPLQQTTEKKKKKKNQPTTVDVSQDLTKEPLQLNTEKKKKKKKQQIKLYEEESFKENVAEEKENQGLLKKKKKRKLDVTNESEVVDSVDSKDSEVLIAAEEETSSIGTPEDSKRKKKKKTKRNQVSALPE